jgi:hypothetical protein
VIAVAIFAARCGSSSSNPSNPTPTPSGPDVSTVVTGVQAADGTRATQQTGNVPAASGGPSVTATGNTQVINGGSDVIRLQAAQAFQTIFVSVPNTTGISPASTRFDPFAAATGFWRLQLSAPTTDTIIVVTLARSLPGTTFTMQFAVGTAAGAVGAPVTSSRTVNTTASTGDVQVALSWNTASDVDLHVVDPRNEEVYWNNSRSASGGTLDLDSNAGCSLDNRNNENIRWPSPAPAGNYIVRVDYWSACNVTGTTAFSVVVNNGGTSSTFTGTFSANDADRGGAGSGREITRFTRAGIATDTVPTLQSLAPLFTPSALKQRLSRNP